MAEQKFIEKLSRSKIVSAENKKILIDLYTFFSGSELEIFSQLLQREEDLSKNLAENYGPQMAKLESEFNLALKHLQQNTITKAFRTQEKTQSSQDDQVSEKLLKQIADL